MNKTRLFAAALLAACTCAAQAQSEEAPTHGHFGFQFGNASVHSKGGPVAQAALGYDFDKTWSVEGVVAVSLLFIRDGGLKDGDHLFNSAVGARGLATLPVSERLSLVAGLGVVHYSADEGTAQGTVTHTGVSPLVSVSLMYHRSRRWSLGAEVSSYTQAHIVSEGLRAEFHF